jgi:polyphosphate kinase 2 (PPK2 family)
MQMNPKKRARRTSEPLGPTSDNHQDSGGELDPMTKVRSLIADLSAGRIRYAPEIQEQVRQQELTEANFRSQRYILQASQEPLDARDLPTEIVASNDEPTYNRSVTERSQLTEKETARDLKERVKSIHDLADQLYIQQTESLLVLLEGDNADGKDGALEHVFKLNPSTNSGMKAFKRASSEEREHGANWRIMNHLPAPGQIGFHNRSAYGDVVFACQSEPERRQRVADIQELEYGLTMGLPMTPDGHVSLPDATGHVPLSSVQRPPIRFLKIFLNVSKPEQAARLADRLLNSEKLYKESQADIDGHSAHLRVQTSFANAMSSTSTAWAPTYIIPNDNKKMGWRKLAQIVDKLLSDMDPQPPDYKGGLDFAARRVAAKPLLDEVEQATH